MVSGHLVSSNKSPGMQIIFKYFAKRPSKAADGSCPSNIVQQPITCQLVFNVQINDAGEKFKSSSQLGLKM